MEEGLYDHHYLSPSFLTLGNGQEEGLFGHNEEVSIEKLSGEGVGGQGKGQQLRNGIGRTMHGDIGIATHQEIQENRVLENGDEKRALPECDDCDMTAKRRKYGELISEIESAEGDETNLGAPARKAQREKKRRDRLNNCFATLAQLCSQDGQGVITDKLRIVNEATRLITSMKDSYDSLLKENKELRESVDDLRHEKKELREEKKFLKVQLESYMHSRRMDEKSDKNDENGRQGSQGGFPYFSNDEIDTSRDAQLFPPVA